MIVELKRVFGLGLVLQGVDRLALSDRVYLAVGQWPKRMRNVKKLCRRLGLGLMVVVAARADIVLDPVPYRPRLNKRKAGRLLGEHARRVGDPNRGGSTTRVPMMTAYRQEALRCAELSGQQRADEAGGIARGGRRAARGQPSCSRMSMAGSSGSNAASIR